MKQTFIMRNEAKWENSPSLPTMEAFSLLKYWKAADNATLAPPYTDGPFFDLELAITQRNTST